MTRPSISMAALVAASVLSAAGALIFNIFPLFLSATADQFGFENEQLGLLGTAYLGGFSLVALTAVYWVKRISWKFSGAVSIILVCLSVLGLAIFQDTVLIYTMVALIGAGSCVIFTVALTVLSRHRDPDRAYGIKLCAEMLLAGIIMFVMTSLIISRVGFVGFIVGLVVIYGVAGLALLWLPQDSTAEQDADPKKSAAGFYSKASFPAWLASIALFIQFGVMSALWGFMERIGSTAGIDAQTVGTILTLSLLAGLVGAFLAALLGNHYGHIKPLFVCFIVIIATIYLLANNTETMVYALCACLISASLQFIVAYQMGLITAVDQNENFTTMIPFILAFGGAVGPGVAGSMMGDGSFTPVYILAVVMTLLCSALTILVGMQRRSVKPTLIGEP